MLRDENVSETVPSNIQALRCLVNYEALRFAEPVRVLADDMVVRMIKRSSLAGGKYVSVHLRFEEDMVAGRRKLKWEMPVKGAGEGSFTDLVELSIPRQTEGMGNAHLLL